MVAGMEICLPPLKLKKIQPLAEVRESLIYLWAKMLSLLR